MLKYQALSRVLARIKAAVTDNYVECSKWSLADRVAKEVEEYLNQNRLVEPPPRETGWYWCDYNKGHFKAMRWTGDVWCDTDGRIFDHQNCIKPSTIKLPNPPK